ncbi:hypothetical protein K2F54_02805 [Cryobacterium sp. 1639]|nr:hypothetical protein [Cryobacterium sp. 1639]MBX0298902.1 hypothetical protein [Cryobacterium sp. 1639]
MSDVTTGTAATVATDEAAPARPLIQLLNQDADVDAGGCCGGGACGI